MAHFPMTDKAETKTLQCTYPGCEHTVGVTKFFAPAKARCPEHAGKPSSIIRAMVAPTEVAPDVPPTPNKSLRDLRCPFDEHPMEIIRIQDGAGFVTFKCPECRTAVELKPNWAALIVNRIPNRLKYLAEAFNDAQRETRNADNRVLVGSFKSEIDGTDKVWRNQLPGERHVVMPQLFLDAGGFALGATITVYEPEVTNETKPE